MPPELQQALDQGLITREELREAARKEMTRRSEQTRAPKTLLGKIGSFVAPTTAEVIGRRKAGQDITGRQFAGAALETAAFLLPSTAILRGLGILGRVARVGTQTAKATKVGREVAKLKTGTKEGAKVVGTSGALLGAAQPVADEEAGITDIAGGAAIGAAAGVAGGAVLGLVKPLASLGKRTTTAVWSRGIAEKNKFLFKGKGNDQQKQLAENMKKSLYEDEPATQRAFDKIISSTKRRKGPKNEDEVFDLLAKNGLVPVPEGKLLASKQIGNANFALDETAARIKRAAEIRGSFLERLTKPKTVSVKTFQKEARNLLEDRTDADEAAFVGLKRVLKNQTKGKTNLTAKEINEIVVRINAQKYTLHGNMISRTGNNLIDSLVPKASKVVRNANREMEELFTARDFLNILHRKPLKPGFIEGAIGRFAGLQTAGLFLGAAAVSANPLFLAAIGAQFGLRAVTSAIIKQRFNPKIIENVREAVRKEGAIFKKIWEEATPQDKKILEQVLSEKELVIVRGKQSSEIAPKLKTVPQTKAKSKLPEVVRGKPTAKSDKAFEKLRKLDEED